MPPDESHNPNTLPPSEVKDSPKSFWSKFQFLRSYKFWKAVAPFGPFAVAFIGFWTLYFAGLFESRNNVLKSDRTLLVYEKAIFTEQRDSISNQIANLESEKLSLTELNRTLSVTNEILRDLMSRQKVEINERNEQLTNLKAEIDGITKKSGQEIKDLSAQIDRLIEEKNTMIEYNDEYDRLKDLENREYFDAAFNLATVAVRKLPLKERGEWGDQILRSISEYRRQRQIALEFAMSGPDKKNFDKLKQLKTRSPGSLTYSTSITLSNWLSQTNLSLNPQ